MDDKTLTTLRSKFADKPTPELREIVNNADTGDWTEEAIFAAREILADRPDEIADGVEEMAHDSQYPPPIMAMTPERLAGYRNAIRLAGMAYLLLSALPICGAAYLVVSGAVQKGFVSFFGLALTVSAALFLCGMAMRRPSVIGYSYALAISGLTLFFFPLGTILGVVSLWNLGKGKEIFFEPVQQK